MRTGYRTGGPVEYPTLGSLMAKELGDDAAELPEYVSISPYEVFNPAAYGPGFLGPRYAPATVGGTAATAGGRSCVRRTCNWDSTTCTFRRASMRNKPDRSVAIVGHSRTGLLGVRPERFRVRRITWSTDARSGLMRSQAATAFDLDQEPAAVRDAYGRGRFGQGCLLARRLVERGVPFVEVTLGGLEANSLGWDTHQNNFNTVKSSFGRSGCRLEHADARVNDARLLAATTILWMGEFGRTPKINAQAGRDHFPNAWSSVLAGGGIRGGQAYGRTSPDGMAVIDNPAMLPALWPRCAPALGIDPANKTPTRWAGRSGSPKPIRSAIC